MNLDTGWRFSLLLALVSILVFVPFVVSPAGTLKVTRCDSGINSIQEAVETAEPGDTVLVESGHYEENISIDKDLTLKAQNPGKVRVDGTAKGKPAMRIGPSEISVTIEGFTVEDAEGKLCDDRSRGVCPDGLSVAGKSSATVENSLFESNGKSGIRLIGSARVTLKSSEIDGNERAGFWVSESAEATIKDIRISNNRNGAYLEKSARMVVSDSNIFSNSVYGINLFGKTSIVLENSLVTKNGKGGLRFENSSQGVVRNNIIRENEGRGLLIQSSAKVTMETNEVKKNAVGVTRHTDNLVDFSENEIFGNTVDLVGDLSGELREKAHQEKADEITLPNEDYSKLQSAVDALEPGGTIYLAGEVTGHAVIDKKMSIEVTENRAGITSRGNTVAPVISLVKDAEVTIDGLRVGDSGGTGIVLGGNARLRACNSSFEDNSEEGIGLWDSTKLQLERSGVKNNGGSGLRIVDSAQLEVRASQISSNKVANVLLAGTSSADIELTKISASEGNGLELTGSSSGILTNCDLSENKRDGVALYSSSRINVAGSVITNNVNGISLRDVSVLDAEKNSFNRNRSGIKVINPEEFRGKIKGAENAFSENDSDFTGLKESIKEKLTE